ncbi:MAG: efflux RND transporter periplasmic adaptor subunit [Chloroflexi bacterium]|nr:efflux RND transporter periplasmic adaptor subunit [Chloroflexota bacterium]
MKNIRSILPLALIVVAIALLAALGYRYWYQPTYDWFSSDDAQVAGALVRIAAPAFGQIDSVAFDVGSSVRRDQVIATVQVAAPLASNAAGPFVPRVLARVTSPLTGTVAVRDVSAGDTVAAGQPIATIVDLSALWVVVNVDEDRIAGIRPGQPADVLVSATSQPLRGRVAQIGSATTEETAPNSSLIGTTSDATKKVPVKIEFASEGERLVPGMSATVTIYTNGAPPSAGVQDPGVKTP